MNKTCATDCECAPEFFGVTVAARPTSRQRVSQPLFVLMWAAAPRGYQQGQFAQLRALILEP